MVAFAVPDSSEICTDCVNDPPAGENCGRSVCDNTTYLSSVARLVVQESFVATARRTDVPGFVFGIRGNDAGGNDWQKPASCA